MAYNLHIIQSDESGEDYESIDAFETREQKKIMIVDDELFNRISAKIILKSAGIIQIDQICDTANNGEEAV